MATRRDAAETWLSVYPVEDETKGWHPEAPVYVNIGVGIGHQCAEFKARYLQVPGRVISLDNTGDLVKGRCEEAANTILPLSIREIAQFLKGKK